MTSNDTQTGHPGTIFLHGNIACKAVCKAIATALEIPMKNIIINNATAQGIDWAKQSVLIHSYDKGDIGWMLDVNLPEYLADFSERLVILSKLLGCAVYRDRHSTEYDDRVDVYHPECVFDGAMLQTEYDENEDPFFFVELVK
jgi:hypothetical protein